MRTSAKMITMSSSELTRGDDVVNNNETSRPASIEKAVEDSALQQCYDILDRGESSPSYLSYVALAIETWNSVCEEEGGMNCRQIHISPSSLTVVAAKLLEWKTLPVYLINSSIAVSNSRLSILIGCGHSSDELTTSYPQKQFLAEEIENG